MSTKILRVFSLAFMAAFFALVNPIVASTDIIRLNADSDDYSVMEYHLTLTPAAVTRPILKYRFTVPPDKMVNGNAITHYLRSQGERSLSGPWDRARKQFGDEVYDWSSIDTLDKDIPLDKLKTASGYFDSYIQNHLSRASRCREVEWGLGFQDLRGDEAVSFLLPSVQQTRSMARALRLQCRLAVMEGRLDDALELTRINYQLGQDVNEMPLMVSCLVGLAEVGMANEGTLQIISAKDAPNIYWPLAELPDPIISARKALQFEATVPRRLFVELDGVETLNLSQAEWNNRLEKLAEQTVRVSQMFSMSQPKTELDPKVMALGVSLVAYRHAKQRLIASDMDPAKVDAMSVAQVILVDAAREIEVFSQEIEKMNCLSYQQGSTLMSDFEDRLQREKFKSLGMILADLTLPATQQVQAATVRVQSQMRQLMAIEAIRHHVATTGALPKTLEELELPVRNNPFIEQPFEYAIETYKGKKVGVLKCKNMTFPKEYKYILEFVK